VDYQPDEVGLLLDQMNNKLTLLGQDTVP